MLNRRPVRGFTLIEMMITVSIVAILSVVAIPSFAVIVAKGQIRTASQALFDGLQLARVEAIRRNERVVFTKMAQSAWTVVVESDSSTVQQRSFADGSPSVLVAVAPAGATKVTFDGLGRVKPNADASSPITQLDTDVPASLIPASNPHKLRITVSTGGAVRLCDPNAAPGVGMGC